MQETDIQLVRSLQQECGLKAWSATQWKLALRQNSVCAQIAWSSRDELVAFVLCRVMTPEMEIESIAVAPAFRRQGLALELFRQTLEKHHDTRTIYLEVNANNSGAHSFYASLGFQQYEFRKDYYGSGEDALLLSLVLKTQ